MHRDGVEEGKTPAFDQTRVRVSALYTNTAEFKLRGSELSRGLFLFQMFNQIPLHDLLTDDILGSTSVLLNQQKVAHSSWINPDLGPVPVSVWVSSGVSGFLLFPKNVCGFPIQGVFPPRSQDKLRIHR